ncbi:MAG: flagellar hook-basal body protein FliE [Rhizobiales bacterium 65-9]|nr:flagellar hook-basal body complex protein FliE [Hyphomicrobiales bacterium]OJY34319.1 MAG: flagellar hook-basal body protein FliE [Rhizobiales bacterium 65-9]
MVTSAFAAGAYAANAGAALTPSVAAKAPAGGGFADMVQQALRGAADAGHKADVRATQAAQGKGDLIDVVTAVTESETAIETLVAVRDRVINAYEEIMRMPI